MCCLFRHTSEKLTVKPWAISSSGTNSGRNWAGVTQGKRVFTGNSVTIISPLAKNKTTAQSRQNKRESWTYKTPVWWAQLSQLATRRSSTVLGPRQPLCCPPAALHLGCALSLLGHFRCLWRRGPRCSPPRPPPQSAPSSCRGTPASRGAQPPPGGAPAPPCQRRCSQTFRVKQAVSQVDIFKRNILGTKAKETKHKRDHRTTGWHFGGGSWPALATDTCDTNTRQVRWHFTATRTRAYLSTCAGVWVVLGKLKVDVASSDQ